MSVADQRHAIEVARRFAAAAPDASAAEVAGALLHDIGKLEAQLGTIGRVVATIAGPRTGRFRSYHDHEAIGAQMLVEAGSDPVTVELVQGRGRSTAALRAADHV
jgi:putative nucleotidyltransferase with HDIG domain